MATMTARKSKTWREFDPSPAKHGLDPVELDTPRQLGAQREQLLASLPQAEEAIKVAEDALGDAELWGTSSEVSKAETTLRKAREALDQVTRRLRAIDRALAEQKIRNQELAERAMANVWGAAKAPHADLVQQISYHLHALADLCREEREFHDRVRQATRDCLRASGARERYPHRDLDDFYGRAGLPQAALAQPLRLAEWLGNPADSTSSLARWTGFVREVGDYQLERRSLRPRRISNDRQPKRDQAAPRPGEQGRPSARERRPGAYVPPCSDRWRWWDRGTAGPDRGREARHSNLPSLGGFVLREGLAPDGGRRHRYPALSGRADQRYPGRHGG